MARNAPSIDTYGQGGFRLSGARHEGSVLIVGDLARTWPVAAFEDLTVESLAPVFALGSDGVEFVLLGMGAKLRPPPGALRVALAAAGIGLEAMDTATAARMYNVLTSEGRRIAAALIAI